MVKQITKTTCIALIVVLCTWNLSAQTDRYASIDEMIQQHSITTADCCNLNTLNSQSSIRGEDTEVILGTYSAAYKGTVANPFGPQIGSPGSMDCLDYIDGQVYGIRWQSGKQFGTVNTSTGEFNVIDPNFHTQGTDGISISYNPVDGKTYVTPWTTSGSFSPRFGTVDLATGAFTTIAIYPTDGQHTYFMAIDQDGTCYAVRNLSNEFGTINLATGVFTVNATLTGVGTLNFIQDLSFDRETGDLYWLARTNTVNGYYKINKTTGALTHLSPNSLQPSGFTICNSWGGSPCPVVTDVAAALYESARAKVTWTAPAKALTNYKVYQNGVEKATIAAGTTEWISAVLSTGTYTFSVAAFFDDGCTPVKVAAPPIEIKTCFSKVSNVKVDYTPDCNIATITWDAPSKTREWVIFDNGPLITHPGAGPGGSDYSSLKPGQGNLGGGFEHSANWWAADDFTLSEPAEISKMEFYGFQPFGSPTNLFSAVYVKIYTASPDQGGTPIFGDQTTNRLISSSFTGIYRTDSPTAPTYQMPIMKIVADVPLELAAGTYWVCVSAKGTTTGQYAFTPPVVIWEGTPVNPNGLVYHNAMWKPFTDEGGTGEPLAMAFKIYGDMGDPPDTEYNVYRDTEQIASLIKETTFQDKTFDSTKSYTWSVSIACPSVGEGEWISVNKGACIDLPPCNPVTNASLKFEECTSAVLTWADVAGAKEFKILRNESLLTITTATTYTDVFNFVPTTTYKWEIITICESGMTASPLIITGNCSTGIINEFANNIAIYPNPTTGKITVYAPDFAKVEIHNSIGQLLETKTVNVFDISTYNTGVYFFKIYDVNNNTAIKRVMVGR
jgi:hypothetical protein